MPTDQSGNQTGERNVAAPGKQDPFKVKGDPAPAAPAATDTSAHEKAISDGIKGLVQAHLKGITGNAQEDSALAALDKGISEAPGNTANH